MTFYVKRSNDAETEGPFTVEQINQRVREKRLAFNSLALADNDQGLQRASNTPIKQWIRLDDISGFKPDPNEERKYVFIILIIIALSVLIPVALLIWLTIMLKQIH